jgi:hypothetical protein
MVLALAAAVLVVCGAAWSLLGVADPGRADAVGLAALCGEPADLVLPTRVSFKGDAVTGEKHEFTNLPALAMLATPPDPDGSPSITAATFHSLDLNGDGVADVELALGERVSTAPETVDSPTGATPLDALLSENFGGPPAASPLVGVEVHGVDLVVKFPAGSWIRTTPKGHYAAKVGVRLERFVGKEVLDYLDVEFKIDSLQAAARSTTQLPDEVRMSLAQKDTSPGKDNNDSTLMAVSQEVVYAGVATDDHPPLDTGATVTQVAPDGEGTPSPLFDVDLAWNRVPDDFAVGISQTCPTANEPFPVAHFATNLPQPAATGHDLDVVFRSGIDGGLDNGDEVRVEGRIERLARRMDLLEREGIIDLVHTTDAAPNVRLRRLDLAVDDPTTLDDEPIHAYGRLDGLPPHVRIDHASDKTTGDLTSIAVTACPEIDRSTDLIWYFLPTVNEAVESTGRVDGCIPLEDDPDATTIRGAHLVVQNFLPDGTYGGAPSANLPVPPPPMQLAERVTHYEQPMPDRPWEPRSVDLPAVERTTFALAAAGHPAFPSGPDPDVLLVRAGADLTNVESLRFRTEAGSRRPSGRPSKPDDRTTFGARDTTTISTKAETEPFGQVIGHLDRRTHHVKPEQSEGALLDAHGVMAPFPDTIESLSFESLGSGTVENVADTAPLRVRWDLPTATVLALDTVHLQQPGRDADGAELPATEVRGEARLSMPSNGVVELAERTETGSERSVLGYEPGEDGGALRLQAAVRVTTATDREAGRALRIAGDARVTERLTMTLDRGADDGRLVEATVDACASATGCDNDVHVNAELGRDTRVPTLTAGVTPPAPEPPRPWVVPGPPASNNVRVVISPDSRGRWGASLDLLDLTSLSYRPEPDGVCIGSGIMGPMTVLVQLPDAWFDGRLNRVPAETRIRVAADGNDPDEPWIWLDTTSCTTAAPPIEATRPAAGPGPDDSAGRPLLEATAVFSPPGAARDELPAPPAGPPMGEKISAHAETAVDGSYAVAAEVRVLVPDHLLVWRPDTACGLGGDTLADLFRDLAACASPQWQHTDHLIAGLRVQSTRPTLGTLTMSAHVGTWDLEGSIPELPGSLHVGMTLSQNGRLESIDALVDVEASGSIGDVRVAAKDRSPARTGFTGDAVGLNRSEVPEYSLILHNAGDELHVTARQRTSKNVGSGPVTGDQPGEVLCPGYPATRRGKTGVGYVHADVRLDGVDEFGQQSSAESLTINVVDGPDDPRGTKESALLATVNSDRPIEATVRTRLNNMVVHVDSTVPDIIGRGGWGFLPLGVLDLFIGDTTFDACLDFDLPLELTLTDTTTAQFANRGGAFSLDADNAPGADVALRVGEFESPTPRPGIPFAYRSVDFDFPDQRVNESGGNHWKDTTAIQVDPGGTTIATCHNNAVAYFPGIASINTSTMLTEQVTGAVTQRDWSVTEPSLTRTTFMLDLLWTASARQTLANRDLSLIPGCPGTTLFQRIARTGPAPIRMPVGRVEFEEVESAEYTLTPSDLSDWDAEVCAVAGWDTSASYRPESGAPDYPLAIGADGTRYSLNVRVHNSTTCDINLVARYANGGIRWIRPMPSYYLPMPFGGVEWTVRILPDPDDGSVEVQIRQRDLTNGNGSDHISVGRLDASGRGEIMFGAEAQMAPILRQLVGVQRRLNPPDVAVTGGCTQQTMVAPAMAPEGVIRVWYFGDGSEIRNRSTSVNHCYTRGGDYYAQYVDYRNGQVVGSRRWEVVVQT